MGLIKSKFFPFIKNAKKALAAVFVSRRTEKKDKDISKAQTELDKKMVYSLSKSKIPTLKQIKYVSRFLTKKEIWLIRSFVLIIILNLSFLGFNFYKENLKVVPVRAGSYSEALVGAPKHINPLYSSVNDVDSDISGLIFSSLFKYDNQGNIVKDLAKDYKVGQDGKEYTIEIKEGVKWHDGSNLVADDIIFTFKAIKNPAYDSPLRGSFSGVSILKLGKRQIKFTLSEKYAPFLDLLTFGILPREIWSRVPINAASLAELNLKPIGSGPYKFKSLVKDKMGNIKTYNLQINEDYYGVKPYIENLVFKFYPTFVEAISSLNNNNVDGLSYLPYVNKNDIVALNSLSMHELELPQIDSVFFNLDSTNKGIKDLEVRKALAYAVSKEEIVSKVLNGAGKTAEGPLLESNFAFSEAGEEYEFDPKKAENILDDAGWKRVDISEEEIRRIRDKEKMIASTTKAATSTESDNEGEDNSELPSLTEAERAKLFLGPGKWRKKEFDEEDKYLYLSIATVNEERNARVAGKIKEYWENVGVKTEIKTFSVSRIQTEIIEPRNYEALLFSQFVGHDPDSYAFWHSSQAGKGGFNLSNYANEKADELLEEGRAILDKEKRKEKYEKFQELISKDVPAIFLYSPSYSYVQSKKIKGFQTKRINDPSGRLKDISSWYVKTGKRLVW